MRPCTVNISLIAKFKLRGKKPFEEVYEENIIFITSVFITPDEALWAKACVCFCFLHKLFQMAFFPLGFLCEFCQASSSDFLQL